jgi:hypothetical protein
MKVLETFRFLSLLAGTLMYSLSFASFGGGSIMGQVTDPETKEPIEFATVVLNCQGVEKVYVTDVKGYYYASNIPAGTYTITASYIGKTMQLPPISIGSDETRQVDIAMGSSINLGGITYVGKKSEKPLLNIFDPTAQTLNKKDLEDAPILNVKQIPALMNLQEVDGNYYVRGSREGGLAWYIDGCKIMGDPNIPVSGVQIFRTYANFIPAKYGDTTGGVVAIETRNWFTE